MTQRLSENKRIASGNGIMRGRRPRRRHRRCAPPWQRCRLVAAGRAVRRSARFGSRSRCTAPGN